MINVLIRPLCIEDAKSSYNWRNDPEIWTYTGSKPDKTITHEIEKEWLQNALKDETSKRFAILVDTTYVGNIQLTNIDLINKTAQYHTFIGEKKYWGKGIATLASLQIIHYAKEVLHLKSVYLTVKAENIPAIKVYEKLNFKLEDENKMRLVLDNKNEPLVSVFMITYNHEDYIAQALDGILMQKTNFGFNIVVGEDFSSDKTREVLINYAEKYPGKFKLILHEKNVGAMQNQLETMNGCTGKYIALCEGDDYWTDPHKLQKQIDILESNQEYALCFTDIVCKINDDVYKRNWANITKEKYSFDDIIKENIISTCSVVFKNNIVKSLPNFYSSLPIGDWPLYILLLMHGNAYFLNNITAVYRVHNDGGFSTKGYKHLLICRKIVLESFYNYINENFRKKLIIKALNNTYYSLYTISIRDSDISEFEYCRKKLFSLNLVLNNPFLFVKTIYRYFVRYKD